MIFDDGFESSGNLNMKQSLVNNDSLNDFNALFYMRIDIISGKKSGLGFVL